MKLDIQSAVLDGERLRPGEMLEGIRGADGLLRKVSKGQSSGLLLVEQIELQCRVMSCHVESSNGILIFLKS